MMPYHLLMHPEAYRIELTSTASKLAGSYLHRELQGKDISSFSSETFMEHLVATKPPLIFAESSVYGNGKNWNQTELSILGDIGVAIRVQVYDDGKHSSPEVHTIPFPAVLLFIPGALLKNGTGNQYTPPTGTKSHRMVRSSRPLIRRYMNGDCYHCSYTPIVMLKQGNQDKPQLCKPIRYAEDGDDYSDCLLYSIVAWDHVSWPGNDFYAGARATDDGVNAAATSSMAAITGIQGQYNPASKTYNPPAKYRNWEKDDTRLS